MEIPELIRDRPGLENLARQWIAMSKRRFICANQEIDPMGKRVIEHGAIVYFNCGQELLAAVRLDRQLKSFHQD